MNDLFPWPDEIEWIRCAVLAAGILLVIGISELLRSVARFHPEYSRKTVHILVGSGLLFAPRLFISPIPLLVLSVLFILVNGIAIRTGVLKGMHEPGRPSWGTVYFPLSLFVLTLVFWNRSPEIVVLSMFAFSIGDAAAALVGGSMRQP